MRSVFLTLILLLTLPFWIFGQISEYSEIAITPAEVWNIDGNSYQIAQTVITGNALYAIHVIVNFQPEMNSQNEDIARSIAQYAIENGYLRNALKYNLYSNDFHIREDLIGVALIKIDHTTGGASGSRFAFETNQIFDTNNSSITDLEINNFNSNDIMNLKIELEEIINTRLFDNVLDLYSPEALDDFNEDDARQRIRVTWSLARQIIIQDEYFIVYVGTKNGTRGFELFFPIKLVPHDNPEINYDAYIKILLVEESDRAAIYSIEMNYPTYEVMQYMLGPNGQVEFEVRTD